MSEEKTAAPFASLSEARQAQAMARYEVLRPHLDDTVPLPRAAAGFFARRGAACGRMRNIPCAGDHTQG